MLPHRGRSNPLHALLLNHVQPAATSDVAAPGSVMDEASPTIDVRALETEAIDLRPAAVRAWARTQGLPVSDRGRLPQELVEAYRAAQPS